MPVKWCRNSFYLFLFCIFTQEDDVDDYDHEAEYDYIDPLEKEWILAAVRAELDTQQRLLATDCTLLNRKDFLHGYTGLHWAAKHGRMDILSMLLDRGALVDAKSVSCVGGERGVVDGVWLVG